MKRFRIFTYLLFLGIVIILVAWCIISSIYNSTPRTISEQFIAPLQISIVTYGFAILLIFCIGLIGTIRNKKHPKNEAFFGFFYFLIFSVALIILYLITFYQDIFRQLHGKVGQDHFQILVQMYSNCIYACLFTCRMRFPLVEMLRQFLWREEWAFSIAPVNGLNSKMFILSRTVSLGQASKVLR